MTTVSCPGAIHSFPCLMELSAISLLGFQILFGARIHGNGHTVKGGIFCNILAHGMSGFHAVQMFINRLDYFTAQFVIHLVGSNDNTFNGNRMNIFFLPGISAFRNAYLRIVGIFLHQFICFIAVDIDNSRRFIGRQILNGGSREPRYNDACIYVAVFKRIGRFAEGQETFINIIISNTVSG